MVVQVKHKSNSLPFISKRYLLFFNVDSKMDVFRKFSYYAKQGNQENWAMLLRQITNMTEYVGQNHLPNTLFPTQWQFTVYAWSTYSNLWAILVSLLSNRLDQVVLLPSIIFRFNYTRSRKKILFWYLKS